MFQIEWDDDFTITVSFEVVGVLEMLPQDSVVVDLAIDGQSDGAFVVDQGLGTAVDADDTQTFMAENGVVSRPVARPVRPTMAQALDALQGLGFKSGYRRMAAKQREVSGLLSLGRRTRKKQTTCNMQMHSENVPMAGEDTTHD